MGGWMMVMMVVMMMMLRFIRTIYIIEETFRDDHIQLHLLMLALFTYALGLVCAGGGRRFCPLLFRVRGLGVPPVVVELLLLIL